MVHVSLHCTEGAAHHMLHLDREVLGEDVVGSADDASAGGRLMGGGSLWVQRTNSVLGNIKINTGEYQTMLTLRWLWNLICIVSEIQSVSFV